MRRTTHIVMLLSLVSVSAFLSAGSASGDPQNFMWIERDGAVQFGPLARFAVSVHEGQIDAPDIAPLIANMKVTNGDADAESVKAVGEYIAQHGAARPLLASFASDEAVEKASAEFKSTVSLAEAKPKGIIQGNLYRMRNMDGSESVPDAADVLFLLPADPALWGKIAAKDISGSQAILRQTITGEMTKQIAEGKTDLEKTLEILKSGGMPAFSDPGWTISQEVKKQLRLDGTFDTINDYKLIQDYAATGAMKHLVRMMKPGSGGEFKFDGLIPTDYLLYYRQDLVTYLYWITLTPAETKNADVFKPFAVRTFAVEG